MNGYDLSRAFFDWASKNPEKNKPAVGVLFFWIIEKANRQHWENKIILPSSEGIHMIGVRSYPTFIKALEILEKCGFISFLERSKNQFTTNIIALKSVESVKKEEIVEKPIPPKTTFPSYEEFQEYAEKMAKETNLSLDLKKLELKYSSWKQNNWHNGHDKKIVNWKTTLNNTLPYLQQEAVTKKKETVYAAPKKMGEISENAFLNIVKENQVLFSVEDSKEFDRHYHQITQKNDFPTIVDTHKSELEKITEKAYQWYCEKRAGKDDALITVFLKGCQQEKEQLFKFYAVKKYFMNLQCF